MILSHAKADCQPRAALGIFRELIENYGHNPTSAVRTKWEFHVYVEQKRCNTPLSPDFYAAAQVTISTSCVPVSQPRGTTKIQFLTSRRFAYQLTRKFVVRGGYGIFYGGFENSVVETYNDFPFQFYLEFPI